MAFRFTMPGFGEVEVDTIDEFLALRKAVNPMPLPPPSAGIFPPSPTVLPPLWARNVVAGGDVTEAGKFLKEIASKHPVPVGSDRIAEVLECQPRGIGSVLRRIRAVIFRAGFNEEDAFVLARKADGKEYRAGPKIVEIIGRIDSMKL